MNFSWTGRLFSPSSSEKQETDRLSWRESALPARRIAVQFFPRIVVSLRDLDKAARSVDENDVRWNNNPRDNWDENWTWALLDPGMIGFHGKDDAERPKDNRDASATILSIEVGRWVSRRAAIYVLSISMSSRIWFTGTCSPTLNDFRMFPGDLGNILVNLSHIFPGLDCGNGLMKRHRWLKKENMKFDTEAADSSACWNFKSDLILFV